jgi:hypothetical protein
MKYDYNQEVERLEKSYQQNEKGPCFFISLPPHFYRKSAVAGSFKR